MSLTDIMSGAGLSWYAQVGLVLFFIAFVVIVWRTLLPSRRARLERDAELPFHDDTSSPPPRGRE